MKEQSFWIEGQLPGYNKVQNTNRANRYAGAALKKDIEDRIVWSIRSARLAPIQCPVSIEYTWIEPNKRRDLDNIASARKFIQDALVKAGILKGDGRKYIEDFGDNFEHFSREHPGVLVEIRSLEDR